MADILQALHDCLLDNQMMQDSLFHSEWIIVYITNLLYQKKAYFMSFCFMYKKAYMYSLVCE